MVFTPSEPLWLAGYAARTGASRGVLTDLKVRALALRDEAGKTFLLASVDIIAVPASVGEEAARVVREKYPEIERENFCFCATHTHYGPELRPDKVVFFKVPAEYAVKIPGVAEKMARDIATVMMRAVEDLSPVKMYARRSEAGFAHNRRGGLVTDHDVPILDIRRGDGAVKALVFGYASHNTTMDPQDRLYSSDWAGRAAAVLEEKHPGATALFLTGCAADQNPHPRGTQALSMQYGNELAEAVEKVLGEAGVEVAPRLEVAAAKVALEMKEVTREGLAAELASDDPPRRVKARHLLERMDRGETLERSYPAPYQVVRLGEQVLMILMSSETVIDWAHLFKKEFEGMGLVWVAGYCNDMYGYVPTARVQKEGGYEGGRATLWSWMPATWTEDVEERVTKGVRGLVKKVTSRR